jgi:hypothetical protein
LATEGSCTDRSPRPQGICSGWAFDGSKVAQLLPSRNPTGLAGLILAAPAPPTPVRFPEEIRQQQIHAYDARETVLQTIGFLTAPQPSSNITEQIIEDSLGGSREAVLAWPT